MTKPDVRKPLRQVGSLNLRQEQKPAGTTKDAKPAGVPSRYASTSSQSQNDLKRPTLRFVKFQTSIKSSTMGRVAEAHSS